MKKRFVTATKLILIFLWVYTAMAKLSDLHNNINTLKRSPFIKTFAELLALYIPFAELLTACLLIIPATHRKGLWSSLILLSLFTGYIILVLSFASWQPCTCGGIIQTLTWKQHIAVNTFLIMITTLSISFTSQNLLQSGSCRKPVTE